MDTLRKLIRSSAAAALLLVTATLPALLCACTPTPESSPPAAAEAPAEETPVSLELYPEAVRAILETLRSDERAEAFLAARAELDSLRFDDKTALTDHLRRINALVSPWELRTLAANTDARAAEAAGALYFRALLEPAYLDAAAYARIPLEVQAASLASTFRTAGYPQEKDMSEDGRAVTFYYSDETLSGACCALETVPTEKGPEVQSVRAALTACGGLTDTRRSELRALPAAAQKRELAAAAREYLPLCNAAGNAALRLLFTDRELEMLDWRLSSLSVNELCTIGVFTEEDGLYTAVSLEYAVGEKRVLFTLSPEDISLTVSHLRRYASAYEENLALLRQTFLGGTEVPAPAEALPSLAEAFNEYEALLHSGEEEDTDPTEYVNELFGFRLKLPASWAGLWEAVESGEAVAFYDKANRDYGGLLFTIHVTDGDPNIPGDYDYLGVYGGKTVCFARASGVQYADANEPLRDEYFAMQKDLTAIRRSVERYAGE